MKRLLYLSPNKKMLRTFAGHISEVKMSGCEVVESTNEGDYKNNVDTNNFDLIVVLGEYQFLVDEIQKHGIGKTPVLYLDIYDDIEQFVGATLVECFLDYKIPLREIEKILGVSILNIG